MAGHNFLPLSRQLFTPGNTNVLYGPWASQQEFFDFCEAELIELYRGIVFGVTQNNGTIKEYGNKDTEAVNVFVEIGTVSYDIEELKHNVAIRELINGMHSDTDAKVRVLKNERVIEFEDENGYIERLTIPEIMSGADFSDDFGDDFFNEHEDSFDLSLFQTEYDDRIQLDDKTVVGALNALNGKLKGIPAPAAQKFKGEITLQNLLAITDAQNGDAYAVYAEYNEDGTLSMLDYEYGTNRTAGTIFERANGTWIVPDVAPDFTGVVKMSVRPEKISVIKSLYAETSYLNLYGEGKAGMLIATVENFVLDENGVYQKTVYDKGTPGQRYYSKTSEQKIIVPYARSYAQNGDMVYTEGLLTSNDYKRLMEMLSVKGVFVAEYGRTTHAKIKEANNTGKAVFLKKGTEIYVLSTAATNTDPAIKEMYSFSKVRDSQILVATVNNENAWSSTITTLLKNTDIKTSEEEWSGISDVDVPSTKLVKNTFDALHTVARTGNYNDLINKPTIPNVSGLVTLDTDQRITGNKTFRTSLWGQLSLWADGSYKAHPCINFYSVQGQTVEGVGSIGVERTGYLDGYPAYWQSQQGLPQRLVREDERGSSVNPIYIDQYGKTKECDLSSLYVGKVALNGEELPMSNGKVNVEAMPLDVFGYEKASSEYGHSGYWREELRCTLLAKGWDQSMTQVFVVRDVLGYEWQKAGLLYVSFILNSNGTYSYVSLASDNPAFVGNFAIVADETNNRISIYSKQGSYGKNGWRYLSINDKNYFGPVEASEVENLPSPTQSVTVSYVECYTKPSEYRKFIEIDWQNGSYSVVNSSDELQLYIVSGTYPDDAHFHLLLSDGENVLSRYNDFVSRHRLLLSYTYELNGMTKKYDERILTAPTGVGRRQTGEDEYEYYIDITLNGSMVKSSASIKIMFEEI